MSEESENAGSTAILVLGMQRSGTSATTRVLNLLGVELGSDMLSPRSDNPKGFWEHRQAYEIHKRLMSTFGMDWNALWELPAGWLEHPASLKALEEVVELIRRDFSGVPLWAIKDPRLCRLAPLWIRAFDQLGIRVTALLVVRDPREVAASMHARDGFSGAYCWLLWAQHVLEAVEATAHVPRAMLMYDDLMEDWASMMPRIENRLGISWPRDIEEARPDIEAFISQGDRHHRADDLALEEEGHSPPQWFGRLAKACSATAETGDWSPIAVLHRDYHERAALFIGPLAELTGERNALRRLAIERYELIEQLQRELASRATELQLSIERYGLIEQLQRELASRATEHDGLVVQHEQIRHAFEAKSGELDVLTRESAKLQLLHEDVSARHRQAEESLAAKRLTQLRMEASIKELKEANLRLEEHLQRARAVTRSRKWLLRRIGEITVQRSSAKDSDFG